MKFFLGRFPVCARGRAAFTIIELLAVMAIILVLAGLIINIAGSASYNSAKARATGEIKAMETALESYKSDNGTYPPDPNTPTDGSAPPATMLDPQGVGDSANVDPTGSRYKTNSEYLYQVLSGFPVSVPGTKMATATTTTMSKAYMTFRPDQIDLATTVDSRAPSTKTTSSPYMIIIDPFGFSYGYSTIYAATVAYNNAQTTPVTTPVTVGYNPTFDLWSTAGYAPGGKSTPSSTPVGTTSVAAVYSTLWIKNW